MHNATDAAFQRVITAIKQNQIQLLIWDDASNLGSKHFEILRTLSNQTPCTVYFLACMKRFIERLVQRPSCSYTSIGAMKKVKEESR